MEVSGRGKSLWVLAAVALVGVPTICGEERVFEANTSPAAVERLKRTVSYVLSLREDEVLSLVPEQSGIYFTDCPNCDRGTQDHGNFSWSPERPGEIVCRDCGAKYPGNPDYPDDQVLEVPGPTGPHAYPYYERPGDNYRIYFRAHADYMAIHYMARQCRALADLYSATGEETYGRRSALILLRFAEVYPGYAYHFDYAFRQKRFAPWTTNRIERAGAFRTARWTWWACMDIPLDLVKAYDSLRFWPGLAEMADGRSVEMIEKDLLGAAGDFVLGFKENYHNMSPWMWRDAVYTGRVINRPDWVREVVRRLERFISERFLYDGHWMETSPSYCAQVFGNLRSVTDALEGYEDQQGQEDAADGRSLGSAVSAQVQIVREDLEYALDAPRFPNGRLLPVNDTWARGRRSPRSGMEPVLLPGLGVAVMGGGEGQDQLHAYLNFTSGRGHKHADALSVGLFAFGKELLRDIGYTHTRYRAWTQCTMSHNTVVVNGRESRFDRLHTGNQLRAFVTDGRGFHLAEAESSSAYPELVTRFRRTLILVGTDSRDAYLVDVCQVFGGDQHDYLLHGSADDDSEATVTGAQMEPYPGSLLNPGVSFVPPKGEGDRGKPEAAYGFVHDLRGGHAEGTLALEMRLAGAPSVGTRTVLFPEEGTVVYLGQAPSIRRAGRSDAVLDHYQAPFFCARRTGEGLRSVFAALHEPLSGAPKVLDASVQRLADAVLIVVERGPLGKDFVVVGLDGAANVRQGEFAAEGRYAFARVRNGQVREAHLVGGTRLSCAGVEVTGTAAWKGAVRRVIRERSARAGGAFEVAGSIPPGAVPCTMLIRHGDGSAHAYNVVRIEPLEDGTRLFVREDPALEITPDGQTRFVRYPQRTIPGGANSYEILNGLHFATPEG